MALDENKTNSKYLFSAQNCLCFLSFSWYLLKIICQYSVTQTSITDFVERRRATNWGVTIEMYGCHVCHTGMVSDRNAYRRMCFIMYPYRSRFHSMDLIGRTTEFWDLVIFYIRFLDHTLHLVHALMHLAHDVLLT